MSKGKKKLTNKITEVHNTPQDKKHLSRGVVNVGEGSTDHEKPTFSFDFADDNRFVLWDAQPEYHKLLMKTFKLMGSLTWQEIKGHRGLQMKYIEPSHALPSRVSPEINVLEIRVSQEARLHGFRLGRVFQILWFDPDHEVCPENKVRR